MMLYIRETTREIDLVCDQLRYAAGMHGMHLVAAHDLKHRLNSRGIGFERHCRVFELCHPARAKDALDVNMAAAAVLPTRVAVYEEHGRVKVAAMKPAFQVSVFGSSALPMLAEEDRSVTQVIDEACGADAPLVMPEYEDDGVSAMGAD